MLFRSAETFSEIQLQSFQFFVFKFHNMYVFPANTQKSKYSYFLFAHNSKLFNTHTHTDIGGLVLAAN